MNGILAILARIDLPAFFAWALLVLLGLAAVFSCTVDYQAANEIVPYLSLDAAVDQVRQRVPDRRGHSRLHAYLAEHGTWWHKIEAPTGIVVVPLTGFQCEHDGFRMTLLETDDAKRAWILKTLRESIDQYIAS